MIFSGTEDALMVDMGIASIIGIATGCLQAVTSAASPNSGAAPGKATPFEQVLKSLQDHQLSLTAK
jgi:hypothetical protein